VAKKTNPENIVYLQKTPAKPALKVKSIQSFQKDGMLKTYYFSSEISFTLHDKSPHARFTIVQETNLAS
jgi:hypothetical protein